MMTDERSLKRTSGVALRLPRWNMAHDMMTDERSLKLFVPCSNCTFPTSGRTT